MLILTRKPGESLYIGDDIKITIVELKGHQIRVGITAPAKMRIYREEIYLQILEENRMAAEASQAADIGLEGLTAAWAETKGPASDDSGEKKKGAAEQIGLKSMGVSLNAAALGSADKPTVSGFSSFATSKVNEKDPQVILKRKRSKEAK